MFLEHSVAVVQQTLFFLDAQAKFLSILLMPFRELFVTEKSVCHSGQEEANTAALQGSLRTPQSVLGSWRKVRWLSVLVAGGVKPEFSATCGCRFGSEKCQEHLSVHHLRCPHLLASSGPTGMCRLSHGHLFEVTVDPGLVGLDNILGLSQIQEHPHIRYKHGAVAFRHRSSISSTSVQVCRSHSSAQGNCP